jgi:hypothetical protein
MAGMEGQERGGTGADVEGVEGADAVENAPLSIQ